MATIKICDICGKKEAETVSARGEWIPDSGDPDGGYHDQVSIDLCATHLASVLNHLGQGPSSRVIAEVLNKKKKK